MTRFSFRLEPGTTPEALEKAAKQTPTEIARAINTILEDARSQIVPLTPRGWSGQLASGYEVERARVRVAGGADGTSVRVKGALTNPTLYHDVVEEGRRPGKMPPVAALIPWVGSKLGIPPGPDREAVAFLVARKIGARGFEGAHMVERGWNRARRRADVRLKDAGLRIVRTAERG